MTAHSGSIVVGVADPETMAKLPFTDHGFRLRPIPEVINALQSAGFTVQHRRINAADGAPHLLIGTPGPTRLNDAVDPFTASGHRDSRGSPELLRASAIPGHP